MSKETKETKKVEKGIVYCLEIGYQKFGTLSKTAAYDLLDLLVTGEFFQLDSKSCSRVGSSFDSEHFYFPKELEPELVIKKIYLHEGSGRAQKAMEVFQQAERMGIIKKGKKGKKS